MSTTVANSYSSSSNLNKISWHFLFPFPWFVFLFLEVSISFAIFFRFYFVIEYSGLSNLMSSSIPSPPFCWWVGMVLCSMGTVSWCSVRACYIQILSRTCDEILNPYVFPQSQNLEWKLVVDINSTWKNLAPCFPFGWWAVPCSAPPVSCYRKVVPQLKCFVFEVVLT